MTSPETKAYFNTAIQSLIKGVLCTSFLSKNRAVKQSYKAALLVSIVCCLNCAITVQGQNVTSSIPASNAINQALNSTITINFDAMVDPVNVTAQNITIVSQQLGSVAGTYAGGGTTQVTFTPANAFNAGDHITVTLTDAVVATPYLFQFTTTATLPNPVSYFLRSQIGGQPREDIVTADFNQDGLLDVLTIGGSEILYYEQERLPTIFLSTTIVGGTTARELAVGDLDGDGDLDISVSGEWYRNEISNGTATFTPVDLASTSLTDPIAVDFDKDGDIDLVGINSSEIILLENDGQANPTFTERILLTANLSPEQIAIADLDNDGDLDIVSQTSDATLNNIEWHQNDGQANPTFSTSTLANLAPTSINDIAIGDLDNDGDADIVAVLSTSPNGVIWLENDGNVNPSFAAQTIAVPVQSSSENLKLVDVNGDDALDIVIAERFANTASWLENNGATNPAFTRNIIRDDRQEPAVIGVGDIDGDDVLDFLISDVGNNRMGLIFSVSPSPNLVSISPTSNATNVPLNSSITLNFDGVLDSSFFLFQESPVAVHSEQTGLVAGVLSGAGTNALTFTPNQPFNSGDRITVTFKFEGEQFIVTERVVFQFTTQATTVPQPLVWTENIIDSNSDLPLGADIGDLDGDGDLDFAVASRNDDIVAWYENDGSTSPTFTKIVLTNVADGAGSITLYDMDSDGDVDILATSQIDGFVRIFENDGATDPSFAQHPYSFSGAQNIAAGNAVFRLGGDLIPIDFVAADITGNRIRIFEHSGSSSLSNAFNTAPILVDTNAEAPQSVTLGDVDGDGDLDVMAALSGSNTIAWYEMEGPTSNLSITRHNIATNNLRAISVKSGDFDGDGDLDIVAASIDDGKVSWFENDGASDPTFAEQVISTTVAGARRLSVGDIEGDGDLDIFATSTDNNQLILFRNNGAADPVFAENIILDNAQGAQISRLGDIDNDGDLDILFVAAGANTISWLETTQGPPIEVSIATSQPVGSEAAQSEITVFANIASPIGSDQSVEVVISGEGITAGDYSLSAPVITILENQTQGATTLTIADDLLLEAIETLTISLVNPTEGLAIGTPSSTQIEILDNEAYIKYEGDGFVENEPALGLGSVGGNLRARLVGGDIFATNDELDSTQVTLPNIPNGLIPVLTIEEPGQIWQPGEVDIQIAWDFHYNGIRYLIATNIGFTTSLDGVNWQNVSLPGGGFQFETRLHYANGLWVALSRGFGGSTILTSPNGLDWTTRLSIGSIGDVTYGNGQWVAIDEGSRAYTSTDGINWQEHGKLFFNSEAIIFAQNQFVAIDNFGANTNAYTSLDGINWTAHALPQVATFWNAIVFNPDDNQYVAVGDALNINDPAMITSSDGQNWTAVTNPITEATNASWNDIAYANGLYVAVNGGGMLADIAISTDGNNWTDVSDAIPNSEGSGSNWLAVITGDIDFVAIRNGSTLVPRELYFTPLGNNTVNLTFDGAAIDNDDDDDVADILFNFTDAAVISGDISVIADATGPASSNRGIDFIDNQIIAYTGPGFVEVPEDNGAVTGSITITLGGDTFTQETFVEGTHYTLPNLPFGLIPQITVEAPEMTTATLVLSGFALNHFNANDVVDLQFMFTDSAFTNTPASLIINAQGPASSNLAIDFAVTEGVIEYAGANFREDETMPDDGEVLGELRFELRGDDTFVNSGTLPPEQYTLGNIPNGLIPEMTIDEPGTWEVGGLEQIFWNDIEYANGIYVAAGTELGNNGGTHGIAYSVDGVNWINADVPASGYLDVDYSNGLWVVVSRPAVTNQTESFILYSSDGIHWNQATRSGNQDFPILRAVTTNNNGRWVAVGENTIMYSDDGALWFEGPVNPLLLRNWGNVAYGNGQFVASTMGEVVVSSNGETWVRHFVPNFSRIVLVYNTTLGLFMTINGNAESYYTSPDGITWTERPFTFLNSSKTFAVVNDVIVLENGDFYFVGPNVNSSAISYLGSSSDGINWTDLTIPVVNNWRVIASSPERMVVLGRGLLAFSSRQNRIGRLSFTGNAIDNDASDSVSDITFEFSNSAFASNNAARIAGATGPASSNIGIDFVNGTGPIAVCQDITVQLDTNGMAIIQPTDVDGGSTAPNGIDTLLLDIDAFDCSNVGINTVTLVISDIQGNSDSCRATVIIEDTVAPTALCQDMTVYLDGTGNASIDVTDVDGGSSDACGNLDTLLIDVSDFTCAEIGENDVILTVTDNSGNSDSCTTVVTVLDSIAPIAMCQDITLQLDINGMATITTSDIDNGSTDNCAVDSLAVDINEFDCSYIGDTIVTLTVLNKSGNSATCTATVTIEDTVAPTAICRDITVQLDANGMAAILPTDVDGEGNDNCAIDNMIINTSDFDCSHIGDTIVTLTVLDKSGNSATCTATVTIEDTVAPTAFCQDMTVYLDDAGNASIDVTDVDGGSSDACGNLDTLLIDISDFTCAEIGENNVMLTVIDNSGNSDSCTAVVTVLDSIAPIAICQDMTIYLDGTGNASIDVIDVNGGSSDACGNLDTLLIDISGFSCAEIGENNVILTVIDNSGNSDSCTAVVTVLDSIAPIAMCQDITLQLDINGMATITTSDIDNGSTDNCAVDSLAVDIIDFDCSYIGDTIVTLTVLDESGNSATCTATVTIEDTVAPTALCQDMTVYLDDTGNASIDVTDVDGGSSDACGNLDTLLIDISGFTCAEIGENNIILTVTDNSGNSDSCTAVVTVLDTVAPTALCQDITVYLDGTGNASIDVIDVDGGSSDACGSLDTLLIDISGFSCAEIGENNVILTVTDNSGNSDSCTAVVTVLDSIAPIAICQDMTIYLDGTGNASIDVAEVDGGSSDACGNLDTLLIDISGFSCAEIGENNIILTVIDNSGNSDSCAAVVTVLDTVAPTAFCQDMTVYLDGTGNASIDVIDVDGGSSDACGNLDTLLIDVSGFTCAEIGENNIILTVTDNSGNSDSCTAVVTVLDTVAPTALCQDMTVYLDGTGNASIDVIDVDGGSSDACGSLDTLLIDISGFSCAEIGENNVILTVTDNSGNSDSCTAVVTVLDSIAPIAICQDMTIYLDGTGNASIDVAEVDGGSSDACGNLDTLLIDISGFSCAEIGENNVILTVIDNSGNSDSCTAVVTVLDSIAPIAICQDIIVQLDANDVVTIDVNDIDNGSSDNCGIDIIAVDINEFDCSNIGDNTVTLTVTDVNGNTATCDATVSVANSLAPILTCPSDTTFTANSTGCTGIYNWLVEATDNCSGSLDVTSNYEPGDELPIGTTTVIYTAIDQFGNESTCSFDVAVVTDLEIVLDSVVDANCFREADGEIYVTITGGTPPYDYKWSNNLHDEDIVGLSAGAYILSVADANGCTVISNPIEVNQPSPIEETVDAVINAVDCNGESSGEIDISIGGGVPPYTYLWTNGNTNEDQTGLEAGTHQVTVTDANGCEFLSSVYLIEEPSEINVGMATINHINCNGAATGSIEINASGGTAPYTYLWSDGSTNEDLTNIVAGNYSVTVTDNNGCTFHSDTFTINENDLIEITMSEVEDSECNGEASGSINISVAGGTAPYSYAWSNGELTQDIQDLDIGNYSVEITDALGCTFTSPSYTVNEPSEIIAGTATIAAIACNGTHTGSIEFNPTGGTAPYTFIWSNGSTDALATNLGAGTYSVTIIDANSCSIVSDDVILEEPTLIQISTINITDAGCNGETNGVIDIEVLGGTPSYSYLWSDGSTNQDLTNAAAGNYTVTITDANYCSIESTELTIEAPSSIGQIEEPIVTDVSCNGAADGAINVFIRGGTLPYSFSWSNGETTENISGLEAGSYVLTIIDANECTYVLDPIEVIEPDEITVTALTKDVACFQESTGAIDITIESGIEPYEYLWSNGSTSEDIADIASGDYTVTITDANGCETTSDTISVLELNTSTIQVTFETTPASGNGVADGSITATVMGGSGTYAFEWQDGWGSSPTLTDITNGMYCLKVTDGNGCVALACTEVEIVTSIEDIILVENIVLYPNPTSSFATLEIQLSNTTDVRIEMVDVLGRIVKQFDQINSTDIKAQFDVRTLAAGAYFFNVSIRNNETITLPLVITR